MTHWCQDIERDEAVRAAEDGRTGPLPTLEECIERQKHAAMTAGVKEGFVKADGEWKRLTDDELRQLLMIPKSVSASSAVEPESKGDSMRPPTTKTATVENDFADGPKCSTAVSESGKGQSGMRTERVTLEVTHNNPWDINHWAWDYILRLGKRESVRVVEDPIPPAPVSRPAETRQTKAERMGGGWWFPKYDLPSPPPPPPPAPPRVHRGSGVFDANGDEVPWEGVVAALTDERDAAIRERESLREQLESVACRAATAENRVAELESAAKLAPAANADGGSNHAPAASGNSSAILTSSPAASGAAGTEVVEFWGVRAKQSMAVPPGCASPRRVQSQPFQVFASEREAQAEADRCGGVVFAIPGSEPSAPPASGAAVLGWLTAEERLAVSGAILILDQHGPTNIGRTLNDILARSSPPGQESNG